MKLKRALPLRILSAGLFAGSAGLLAGCGPKPAPVEPTAPTSDIGQNLRLVAHGVNQELSFKADHDGLLNVYDLDSGEYVYRGSLVTGEQFVLEPDSDRATINRKPVELLRDTNRHDEYRLYFLNQ